LVAEAAGGELGSVAARDIVIAFGGAGVVTMGVVGARVGVGAGVVVALAVGVMVVVGCGTVGSLGSGLAVGALGTAIGAGGVRIEGSAAPGGGVVVGASDAADRGGVTGVAVIDGCVGAAAGRAPLLGSVRRTTVVTDTATTARNTSFQPFDVRGLVRMTPFDAPSVVAEAGVTEAGAPDSSDPEPVR